MTLEQIRQVLTQRMQDWNATNQDIDVAYENHPTDSLNTNKLWLRFQVQFGNSIAAGQGNGPKARRLGQIVIQAFEVKNTGTANLTKALDSLVEHFEYYSVRPLHCYEANIVTTNTSEHYYQRNLTINFKCN